MPTDTAMFSTLGVPIVGFAAGYDATIHNIVFAPMAIAYAFQIGGLLTPATLTVTGQGITNNSAFAQTFNVGGLLGSDSLSFTGNGTTAGNAFINVSGNGNLYFSGSSTAASSTIAVGSSGLLKFSGTATGGAASVALSSGGVLDISGLTSGRMMLGALTGGGSVTLGSNIMSLGAPGETSSSMSFGGMISGTGGLEKTGSGLLTFSGNNTFSGWLSVLGGSVLGQTINAFGTGAVNLSGGGGVLLGVGGSWNNVFGTDMEATGRLAVLTGQNVILAGGLNIRDGSVFYIGQSGGYAGNITLLGNTSSLGAGALVYVNYGGIILGDTAAGNFFDAAGATLSMAAGTSLDLKGHNASINELAGTGSITSSVAGSLNLGLQNGSFSGTIGNGTGILSLSKLGNGILTLSGNNSFSGGFNLLSGTVIVGNNKALGSDTAQLGVGTTLQLNDGINLANAFMLNGAASFGVVGTDTGTLSGLVSGDFGVTKTGTGTLILSGNNTFSSGLNLGSGTLVAGALGALGTGSVTLGNGTELQLGLSGNYNNPVSLAANGNATLSALAGINGNFLGGLSVGAGANLALGSAGNTGTLTIHGGTFGTGANLLLNYGGLNIGDAAVAAALSMVGLAVNPNGTFNLNGFDASLGSLSGSGRIDLGANFLTIGGLGGNTSFGGIIGGTGGLIKTGTGSLTLSGKNLYAGLTQVTGGILNVDGSISSPLTIDAGATLGGNGSVGDVTLSGSLTPGRVGIADTLQTGSLTMIGSASLDMDLRNPNTIGGLDNDLLVVNGDLTLDGTLNVNSLDPDFLPGVYRIINYTGNLVYNGLNVGQLPAGVNLNDVWIQTIINAQINFVTAAGTNALQFWNASKRVGDGTITGGNGIWQAGTTNWTSFDGQEANAWQGGFAVFQGAGGTVTVQGNIVFSGLQFVDNGFIIASCTSAVFNAMNDAILRVDTDISGEIAAGITATGSLQKAGGGTLVLSGANVLPVGLQINGGTVVAANAGALGTGDVVFNNISGLTFAADGTWNNNLQVNSGALKTLAAYTGGQVTLTKLNTAANSTVDFGDINNTGKITVMGSDNTINGTTNLLVNGGTLVAGDAAFSDAVSQGSLNVAELAEFDINGFDFTVAGLNGSGTVTNNRGNAIINLQSGSFSGNL